MTEIDFLSSRFQKAVSNIQSRAERFPDDPILLRQSFVDMGLLEQLTNNRNQVVTGRRGTGKSHLLRAMESDILREGGLYYFLDCRELGSGPLSVFGDSSTVIGSRWYGSMIKRITSFAFDEVLRRETLSDAQKDSATDPLNQISDLLLEHKYADIGRCFEKYLGKLGAKYFTIVFDEWVQIPKEAQPYTAELLKRTFIATKTINFKIAAIPLYTKFMCRTANERAGLEVGADVFADLDLDTFLIYDKNKEAVERFYADVLFRHLNLGDGLDYKTTHDWIVRNCFTRRDAFQEMVRAAEGVPRDFLHIFVHSYRDAFRDRAQHQKISLPIIRKAAEKWYLDDKFESVREATGLTKLLQAIIDEVLAGKRARMFIIEQEMSGHPLIMQLIDARLLHLVRRGWAHKENPGARYDVMAIDYGAYASRINTASQPELELLNLNHESIKEGEMVVPFDDMRAIRRVELKREFLSRFEVEGDSER
ncbi:MAG: hypothetical protein PHV33_09860 [Elusimicrobiales bacterium]|nr:hypothetical protein [Elusimicrobiales bacterium]